jgi:molecular chaperone DnaK (HSP70)
LLLLVALVLVPGLALLVAPDLASEAVVGIDLGTTYSVVAVCVAGKVSVVEVRVDKTAVTAFLAHCSRTRRRAG